MKFWKLSSILGGEIDSAVEAASTKKERGNFGKWFLDFSKLVKTQDRDKLDYELPRDFVKKSLIKARVSFFISTDGTLRSRGTFPGDRKINASEAFDIFGGDAMEEALEKGSFKP